MTQSKYLATTGSFEFWDTNREIIVLGPWCLINEEAKQLFEKKTTQFVPSPWKPAVKIKEAADYCYEQYLSILPALTDSLNAAHSVSKPLRYWRILIGPWLLHFIETLYDRYKRLETAISLFPEIYTHILPKRDCCNLSVTNTYEFVGRKVYDDYYNLILFTFVARYCFPHIGVEKPNGIISPSVQHTAAMGKLGRIKLNIKKIAADPFGPLNHCMSFFLPRPRIVLSDMYHITSAEKIVMQLRSLFKIQFMDFKKNIPLRIDGNVHTLRENLKLQPLNKNDVFQNLLCAVIPAALPHCYVEHYHNYCDALSTISKKKKALAVGSAIGWYSNEHFKFYAAEQAANKAIMLDFQHGGGYGMSLSAPTETLAREKDIFFTWGWRDERNASSIPLPSPYMSRIYDSHKGLRENLLFIGTALSKYTVRFETMLFPDNWQSYFKNKEKFFFGLAFDIRKKVLYRPFLLNELFGWNELKRVATMCPEAKFLKEGNLVSWIQNSKLVVVDHPHTSFLEALAINIPSVFYWDHDVYVMRKEAEPYFQLLRDVEILHKSPESAARKVNAVFSNPQSWWQSPDVQYARNEFCRRFACARRDWMTVWLEAFKKIVA